jgi:enoyl-CoA hydratase
MSGPPNNEVGVAHPYDGVALVTIDRAHRFNTLSAEALESLDHAFRMLAADAGIVAVVITGAGGESFAAGADLREVATLEPRSALEFAARGQRVFDLVERSPKVVLAAIDGYCMGGGLDLALSCDVRHASPRAVFAHPGARLGILTGFGGTARLTRLVGRARALELFTTARRVDAAEALAIGLVDAVEDDPVASALESARRVAKRPAEMTAWLEQSAVHWWRKG